jgi:hypothetical protein
MVWIQSFADELLSLEQNVKKNFRFEFRLSCFWLVVDSWGQGQLWRFRILCVLSAGCDWFFLRVDGCGLEPPDWFSGACGGEELSVSCQFRIDRNMTRPASPLPYIRPASPLPNTGPASPLLYTRPASPLPYTRPASPPLHKTSQPSPLHKTSLLLYTRPASPLPYTRPASPLPYTRPASPLPYTWPASPLTYTRPASLLPYTRPASPLPYTRPASPLPYTRPASPIPYTRPASPLPYTRPASTPNTHTQDKPALILTSQVSSNDYWPAILTPQSSTTNDHRGTGYYDNNIIVLALIHLKPASRDRDS